MKYGGRTVEQDVDRLIKKIMSTPLTKEEKENISAMLSMLELTMTLTPNKQSTNRK